MTASSSLNYSVDPPRHYPPVRSSQGTRCPSLFPLNPRCHLTRQHAIQTIVRERKPTKDLQTESYTFTIPPSPRAPWSSIIAFGGYGSGLDLLDGEEIDELGSTLSGLAVFLAAWRLLYFFLRYR